jgi:hypothetical protein
MNAKKYRINVDFPERSLVHLNPELYKVDVRCTIKEKKKEDGGSVFATQEEVSEYLAGTRRLIFENKRVENLDMCKLCLARDKT